MASPFEGWKIKSYINPYRSAEIACEKWLNGQLWGNPIVLQQGSYYRKIHVYGIYLLNWSKVIIEFTDTSIKVVKPKEIPDDHDT